MGLQAIKFSTNQNNLDAISENNVETVKQIKNINCYIEVFNKQEDTLSKLYYLQKINFLLNQIGMNEEIVDWINATGDESWEANLLYWDINPNASFFLKGFQFAKQVADTTNGTKKNNNRKSTDVKKTEYELMQERNLLLNQQEFNQEEYLSINCDLALLAKKRPIEEKIARQECILENAEEKIRAIKRQAPQKSSTKYQTKPLGKTQVNNYNFEFTMSPIPATLVFRVVDDPSAGSLRQEQELDAQEASIYFGEDSAVFVAGFRNEGEKEFQYKPVVLGQYANQGNLEDVAKELQDDSKNHRKIAKSALFYFSQINHCCTLLKKADIHHPDIKLTNFLIHNKGIILSDRKTFIRGKEIAMDEIRSSPRYAPKIYKEAVVGNRLGPAAAKKNVKLDKFMDYQVGMALKEFLLCTQYDDHPYTFEDTLFDAADFFINPSKEIINLSLVAQEMTREDENKRLSVEQFQDLLKNIELEPEEFEKIIEKILPSAQLGIKQEDLNEISSIQKDLKKADNEAALQERLDTLLKGISSEPRLYRKAKPVVIEYYKQFHPDISDLGESFNSFKTAFLKIQLREKKNNAYNSPLLPDDIQIIFRKALGLKAVAVIDPQLENMLGQVLVINYKAHPKIYKDFLTQLSTQLETKLVEEDWKIAPMYRKVFYYLTFGWWQVEHKTEVTSLGVIPLDPDEKKNEARWLQTLYLPSNILECLGFKSAQLEHLKGYINYYKDDPNRLNKTNAETAEQVAAIPVTNNVQPEQPIHNCQEPLLSSDTVAVYNPIHNNEAELLPSDSLAVNGMRLENGELKPANEQPVSTNYQNNNAEPSNGGSKKQSKADAEKKSEKKKEEQTVPQIMLQSKEPTLAENIFSFFSHNANESSNQNNGARVTWTGF